MFRTAVLAAAAVALLAAPALAFADPAWLPDRLTTLDYALFANVAYVPSNIKTLGAATTITSPYDAIGTVPTPYRLAATYEFGSAQFVTLFDAVAAHLVIAFRGTDDMGDAIDDLKAAMVDAPWPTADGVKLHDGVVGQYGKLRASVHEAVAGHMAGAAAVGGAVFHVSITGHSLGGALTTIAAADVRTTFPAVPVVAVTFGSPRVGNAAFAAHYKALVDKTWRVANRCTNCLASPPGRFDGGKPCQDKVSLLPPEGMAEHVAPAQLLLFDSGFKLHLGVKFELRLHSLSSYHEALHLAAAAAKNDEL
jgi:hypothetical protein